MIYADGKVRLAEMMGFSNLMIRRQIYNGLRVEKKNLLFKKRLKKKRDKNVREKGNKKHRRKNCPKKTGGIMCTKR